MAMAATATTNKLANFPAELRALRQWVVWKYETRGDKRTKVPYCPRTHRRASSTSSSTWSDYTTAVGVLSTHSYTGVGFVFAPPHVGIDLDHCRDASTGAVEPWAAAIIGELNSYTEISPSGTGLQVQHRQQHHPTWRQSPGPVRNVQRRNRFPPSPAITLPELR